MNKILFTNKKPIDFIGKKRIFNFLNLDSLWHFRNTEAYGGQIIKRENVNFPDGKTLSRKLKISQIRGPSFTRRFLKQDPSRGKKHFFIGNATPEEITKNTHLKKLEIKVYNPPFVDGNEFPQKEQEKILKMFKKFNPDFVWVCVGSPKQEILSNQLYKKYKADYFNVGAALDFLTGNKKEAPKAWRKVSLEWLYQLLVYPKRAWKKVGRSFVALVYLGSVR